jgi:predicted porin
MKKSLLAAAALAAVSGVAQADVQLYGTLDAAVVAIQHQGANGSNSGVNVDVADPIKNSATAMQGTWNGMVNGGIDASRFGIKGSEEINPGLKAMFQLESCFNITSGSTCNNAADMYAANSVQQTNIHDSSMDGQLFNRAAWVGLESDMGTLRFGRLNALGLDVLGGMGYAPNKNAQQFTPTGYSGTLGGSGGLTEKARLDNAVSYTKKIGEYNFGANYSSGNIAGSSSAGSIYNVNVGYDNGTLGVQAVYTSMTDVGAGAANNTGAAGTSGGITVTMQNIRSYMLAAKYNLSNTVTLKAGLQQFEFNIPSDANLCPAYYGYTVTCSDLAPSKAGNQHLWYAGVDYQYSDNLYLGAAVYNRIYDATPGAANSKNIGFVSLLADYSLSKRTDVYAGAMFVQPGGDGYAGSAAVSNNSIIGAGMRHKF